MLSGMMSSTSQGIRVDTGTEGIAIGETAGAGFSSDDTNNIAIGTGALATAGTTKLKNIAIDIEKLNNIHDDLANQLKKVYGIDVRKSSLSLKDLIKSK